MDPTSALRTEPTTDAEPTSRRWWGLDWREHLPWQFDGVRVEHGTFESVLPFIREHYPAVFGPQDRRWLDDAMTEQKRRFYRESDVFVFRVDGRVIGPLIANPGDWSSYYLRTTALLPEYRSRGILSSTFEQIARVLAARGVDRMETEIPPTNIPSIRMVMRAGFVPTGTTNSDRWGALVRYTRFLKPDADAVFRGQFCAVLGGCAARSPTNQEGG